MDLIDYPANCWIEGTVITSVDARTIHIPGGGGSARVRFEASEFSGESTMPLSLFMPETIYLRITLDSPYDGSSALQQMIELSQAWGGNPLPYNYLTILPATWGNPMEAIGVEGQTEFVIPITMNWPVWEQTGILQLQLGTQPYGWFGYNLSIDDGAAAGFEPFWENYRLATEVAV